MLRITAPHGIVSATKTSIVGTHFFEQAARIAATKGDTASEKRALAVAAEVQKINFGKLRASLAPKSPLIIETARKFAVNPNPRSQDAGEAIADWEVFDARNQEEADWAGPRAGTSKDGVNRITDPVIKRLAESIIHSLNLFRDLGIDSIDNKHMLIQGAAHVSVNLVNAWYADGRFSTGDGDPSYHVIDFAWPNVVGHELGHGIVELVLGGLRYYGLTGALNEHIADLFGIFTDRAIAREQPSDKMRRRIGEESLLDEWDGKFQGEYALRDARNPGFGYRDHPQLGSDRQPASMDKLYTGGGDNGGVHINSGIPNKALSLALDAYGNDYASDLRLGKAWIMAVKKLKTRMDDGEIAPSNVFKEFAKATAEAAQEMYPGDTAMVAAMQKGWDTVRVTGPNAVDVLMDAFEITNDKAGTELAEMLALDMERVAQLREILTVDVPLPHGIANIPGLQSIKAGFQLKANGSAEVVLLVFVNEVKSDLVYPEEYQGFKVVVRQQPQEE